MTSVMTGEENKEEEVLLRLSRWMRKKVINLELEREICCAASPSLWFLSILVKVLCVLFLQQKSKDVSKLWVQLM